MEMLRHMAASALAKHPLSSSDCIQSGTQMILVETKIVLFLMTLNDLEGMNILEGYSPVAGLFECRSSNICAAIYKILTVTCITRSLCNSWASCCNWLTSHIRFLVCHQHCFYLKLADFTVSFVAFSTHLCAVLFHGVILLNIALTLSLEEE